MSRAVIDQPGFRIVVIGMALSIFLGLALRSQISDNRIQAFLDKAVERLQPDFYVDYEHAKVNLSKWGLPFPVLEIQRIRLSPKSSVCQSSQIYIDELEVPISLAVLFGLTERIPKIRMQEVELRFSDSSGKCIFPSDRKIEDLSPQSSPVAASATGEDGQAKAVFTKSTRAELKEVYIEKLRIIYAKRPEQPVLLKQMNVDLKYRERKLSEISIRSKINALKDPRSDIFYINSNLTFIVKAKSEKDIESVLSIDGKMLDGDIQLFAHNITGEQKVAFELAVDKVSAKALLPFIDTDLQTKTAVLERIPISFSFSNSGEIFLGSELGLVAQFKKVLINIENAQVRTNEISFSLQKDKWVFAPFEVDFEGLPLSKLKQSEGLRGRLDSFESLGTVSGRISFKDEFHYHFDGLLQNVEVVFSNRGRRDLQNIGEMQLHLERNQHKVTASAKDFVINGKRLESNLTIQHNLDDFSISAQFKLAGLSLNKMIWEQFTFVEQTPLLDFSWTYQKNQNETHNLRLFADHIEIPGFKFEGLSAELTQTVSPQPDNSQLHVKLHPFKVVSTSKLLDNEYINKLVASSIRVKNRIFTSEKTSIVLSGKNWKNLNFDLQSVLSDIETKSLTQVDFKGSTTQRDGLSSKIVLTHKNAVYQFDFFTTPDSRLILNAVQ